MGLFRLFPKVSVCRLSNPTLFIINFGFVPNTKYSHFVGMNLIMQSLLCASGKRRAEEDVEVLVTKQAKYHNNKLLFVHTLESFVVKDNRWLAVGVGVAQFSFDDEFSKIYMTFCDGKIDHFIETPACDPEVLKKHFTWMLRGRRRNNQSLMEVIALRFTSESQAMSFTKHLKIAVSQLKQQCKSIPSISEKSFIESSSNSSVKSITFISQKGVIRTKPFKRNQDAVIGCLDSDIALAGIFDGHGLGGHLVAYRASKAVTKSLTSSNASPTNALVTALQDADNEICSDPQLDMSGATVAIALVNGKVVTVAHIGDSRVILGSDVNGEIISKDLTADHKPSDQDERKRIERFGGVVGTTCVHNKSVGPERLWIPHNKNLPSLGVSRSIGDMLYRPYVDSTPAVTQVELECNDKFIVTASDGLWDALSSQQVCDIVSRHYKDNPRKAVGELLAKASQRWFERERAVDDISIVLMVIA